MDNKGLIQRRRHKIVFLASTCASVILIAAWVFSYFVGIATFGDVHPALQPASQASAQAASSPAHLEASVNYLMAGGLLLFETAQVSSPPLPRMVPIPVGMILKREVGAGQLARSLLPQRSPMGSGIWVPLWIPLVICATPGVMCRRKLNVVRPRRVRRSGVPKALRFAAVVGTFVLTLFLSGKVVELILATSLGKEDVVSGMRQAWGVGEEGALLVLICSAVFVATASAYMVHHVLAWKRVPLESRQSLSGQLSGPATLRS